MDPFNQLLTQPSGSNVAPETLEMLGRQASKMFQGQGVPLNQAISQVLANHPELGNEHIKRIVEFANTVTFQEMFQSSEDKNVHFDVADPGVVLRDLKDGGSPAHDGKPLAQNGTADYNKAPQQGPSGEAETALAEQFLGQGSANTDGQVKVASASLYSDHELHANPVEDAWDARTRLVATREKLAGSYESMNSLIKQAQEDLYQHIKAQVSDPDGAGLGGVVAVLEKVAEADMLEVILPPMVSRLGDEGYNADFLNKSLVKRAGVVVNLAHPIIVTFDALLKTASEMIACGDAIDEVDQMIAQVESVFKKTAGSLATGIKKAIGPAGKVPSGIRQRFPKG